MLNFILSFIPTKLPVGMTEFNTWANSIIDLSGEYADRDSMLFALSTMIMHADAKHGALPKRYFVSRLRKVAANQVAGQVFHDIKVRQAEAAALAQKTAEDTATTASSSEVESSNATQQETH